MCCPKREGGQISFLCYILQHPHVKINTIKYQTNRKWNKLLLLLKQTFKWRFSPISISDFHMVVPTQVTPVQIHWGEVEDDLENKQTKNQGWANGWGQSWQTVQDQTHEQGIAYTNRPVWASTLRGFIPSLRVSPRFSRCSACRPSSHWGIQEKKSCRCFPVDCLHILFAKKQNKINTQSHV